MGRGGRAVSVALALSALLVAGGCKTYHVHEDPLFSVPETLASVPGSPGSSVAPAAPAATVAPVAPVATVTPPTVRLAPAPPPAAGAPPVTPAILRLSGASAVVVDIDAASGGQHAFGTGIVLTTAGQVLTNNHVIRGARTVTATVPATGRSYPAQVVGADANADVALLQLQAPAGLVAMTVGSRAGAVPGAAVSAVGNAGGRGGAPTITNCVVVATGQALIAADAFGGIEHLTDLIEVSAAPQAGDSGGPLADPSGQVVGMVVASLGGAGYAIPIATVLAVAQQFPPH